MSSTPKVKTYFCQMVTNRLDMMKANIERAYPYFDKFVIVDGGSTDGTVGWLKEQDKVDLVEFKWCDNFPLSRNQYLNRVGEIRDADEISLCCVADDDEFYSQFFLEHVKDFALQMVNSNVNQLAIRCRSVSINREMERVWESLDDFFKPLVFFWEPGIHYADTRLHETLVQPSGMRQARVPDNADTPQEVVYEHIKLENVIWPRGMRNFYTFGGGPNLGDKQPLWKPFREILSRCGNFDNWTDVEKYLAAGNVCQELKDWIIKHRCEGLSQEECGFEHEGRMDEKYDGSSEIRECFLTYFLWFHPEELPKQLIEHDKSYKDYVHEIQKIHGPDVTIGC